MFDSLTSPSLLIANMIAVLSLSLMFYIHHPRKYDTTLIFIVGNMLGLIVRFFVDLEIGVGTGFGLFAIFSLMHFRESYHTYTMSYLFLSISLGILSSLMQWSDLYLFIIIAVIILAVLWLFETFLVSTKKCVYFVPVERLKALREQVLHDLWPVKVGDINVKSIKKGIAKVVVSYRN